jgi:uncharacterized protein (DUF305 family)
VSISAGVIRRLTAVTSWAQVKEERMERHQQHAANDRESHEHAAHRHGWKGAYGSLAIELAIDFVIMYFVMYTMIATTDHLYLNLNNVYMTLMMVAPMALVMLILMRSMFPARRLNWIIGIGAVVIFIGSYAAMRTQAAVDDKEFLRSMIPHHSGAVLMCEQADIKDPEIIALCEQIIVGQQKEIAQMQEILKRH